MNYLARSFFGLALLAAPLAHATDMPPPLAALAARVAPAIVSITALSPTGQVVSADAGSSAGPDGTGPDGTGPDGTETSPTADVQKNDGLVIPPPQTIESLGSGFIFEPSGYILTNNHVVQGATNITVTLVDGTVYPAIIAGLDPDSDLAVLKIDAGHPLPFLTFGDSAKMKVGDWVLAVGNPYGMPNTNTAGIVSALHRQIGDTQFDDFIQTDAAINKGNSGGPLLNMQGQVIGVNSAILAPAGTSDGIGFSIPSSMVAPVANALISNGKMVRGWLGVAVEEVSPEIQKALRLPTANGALVGAVSSNGPSEGKLFPGDVITSLNGMDINNPRALYISTAEIQAGQSVPVGYIRDGKAATTQLTIMVPPSASDGSARQSQSALTGPFMLPHYGLGVSDQSSSGVSVTLATGPAAAAGLVEGDVILQVNGEFTKNTKQLAAQLQKLNNQPAVFFVSGPAGGNASPGDRWATIAPKLQNTLKSTKN